ncbi:MAG TPA: dihydrofolate reductase [Rhizomicrobium sp.]|jgi:dihydrofolate reductase|nr:dihydrofolate reductase [Rhizomicrobium sp.]
MSLVSLVVAMADNGVIGADGTLPWRLPDDLRRFKALTMGKPCVMGRRTWDSLPRRPLPGRQNIVVTRDRAFRANGATVVHSLEEALANAADAEEICVIGGAEIYRAALARADRIHLTEIHADIEGDTRLSRFDRETWRETSREDRKADDGPDFSFVTLERRR